MLDVVQVDVFGPGVRDPVPSAADGGPLQRPLQHLRQSVGLLRRPPGAGVRRRVTPRLACLHQVPRLGRGRAAPTLPLQNYGHAHVSLHAGRRFLGN